jgi:hypothetical protein
MVDNVEDKFNLLRKYCATKAYRGMKYNSTHCRLNQKGVSGHRHALAYFSSPDKSPWYPLCSRVDEAVLVKR